jgi:hypothetical protein
MLKYIFSLVLMVFVMGCSTLKVYDDYDESFDFSKVKTYTIKHNVKPGENTLLNERITLALESVFNKKGYKKVDNSQEDLMFVYHYNVKDKVDIRTDYQMVGVRRYRFGGTMMSTTTTYEYKEGTIIVDAFDKKSARIVWRSIGVLEVQEKDTPQERKEYVFKIINELMKKFPSRVK